MNEGTRKKLVYGLLVAAIIFGAYNFVQPRRKPALTLGDTALNTTTGAGAATVQGKTIDVAAKEAESWGRDPFRAGASPSQVPKLAHKVESTAAPLPTWRLSGIIFNTHQPLALINGRMVGVGDKVDEARVSKIEQTKVTIIYNGAPIDLRVSKG
jgi:hypothetical protein